VAWADRLAFIAPVIGLGFPAILKGWFERVFNCGSAYGLDPDGWESNVSGRVPPLHHKKALVITPNLFSEADNDNGLREPMAGTIDDWGLRYPGVKPGEHECFYRVMVADEATRHGYLEHANGLGREFADYVAGNGCCRPAVRASNRRARIDAAI
jgi:putative NADPH-quinone reductase